MGGFVTTIRTLALGLGAPGLFLVTVLDSSFLSLPEIADLIVVFMVTRDRSRFLLYAASTTVGSLAGSLMLYYLGRKGGEALVRKRFKASNVERAMGALRRHGLMTVLIPSILPPPAPFKIFVLLAGAAGITPVRFTVAILIGRGFRYLALALLALRYGDATMAYVREHGVGVSLALVGLLVAGLLVYLWRSRTQTLQAPADRI